MATFCRQRSRWNSRTSWNERTMPWRAMLSGDMPTSSWPFSMTEPRSGGMKPVSRLNTVVLPAPLGPTRATMAPLRSVNVRSSAATMPPKRLARSRTSSTTGAASHNEALAPLCRDGDEVAVLEVLVLGLGQLLHARADGRLPVLRPEHLEPAGPLPPRTRWNSDTPSGSRPMGRRAMNSTEQDAVADEDDEEGLLGVEADDPGEDGLQRRRAAARR